MSNGGGISLRIHGEHSAMRPTTTMNFGQPSLVNRMLYHL
jgi:hypothetical protein